MKATEVCRFKVFAGNMFMGTLLTSGSTHIGSDTFIDRYSEVHPPWHVHKYAKLTMVGPKLDYYRNLKKVQICE